MRAVGESLSAGEYAEAVRTQQRMAIAVTAFVSRYDAWLTPTLARPPVEIGELYPKGIEAKGEELIGRLQLGGLAWKSGAIGQVVDRIFDYMPFTVFANGAGLPSMNVPLFWNATGLPIGVMLPGASPTKQRCFDSQGSSSALGPGQTVGRRSRSALKPALRRRAVRSGRARSARFPWIHVAPFPLACNRYSLPQRWLWVPEARVGRQSASLAG
jgi:hypothetical protein